MKFCPKINKKCIGTRCILSHTSVTDEIVNTIYECTKCGITHNKLSDVFALRTECLGESSGYYCTKCESKIIKVTTTYNKVKQIDCNFYGRIVKPPTILSSRIKIDFIGKKG